MCGRFACSLNPANLCKASSYKKGQTVKQPQWDPTHGNKEYIPSYNIAPTDYVPVLTLNSHFECVDDISERVIKPMHWGITPSWTPELQQLAINARAETILEKRMFSVPFNKGQRCVVLADGFFEWKQGSSPDKQAYFIYFPQPDTIKWGSEDWKAVVEGDQSDIWLGPRLLTLAGIFDLCNDYYGVTIITTEASDQFKTIHSRMPVVLDGQQAIDDWLDASTTPQKALELYAKPTNVLTFHPVSSYVGNVKNKEIQAIRPIKTNTILNYFK